MVPVQVVTDTIQKQFVNKAMDEMNFAKCSTLRHFLHDLFIFYLCTLMTNPPVLLSHQHGIH